MSAQKQETLLKLTVLSLAAILCKYSESIHSWQYNHRKHLITAFATRLFSVLRFESVIHEFDPYFNYRTTKYLAENGFYSFHNWFDDRVWYPLGRIIGGNKLNITILFNIVEEIIVDLILFHRNHISRFNDNICSNISYFMVIEYYFRYTHYLCLPGSIIF